MQQVVIHKAYVYAVRDDSPDEDAVAATVDSCDERDWGEEEFGESVSVVVHDGETVEEAMFRASEALGAVLDGAR